MNTLGKALFWVVVTAIFILALATQSANAAEFRGQVVGKPIAIWTGNNGQALIASKVEQCSLHGQIVPTDVAIYVFEGSTLKATGCVLEKDGDLYILFPLADENVAVVAFGEVPWQKWEEL